MKKLLCLLLSAIMVPTLCACGGSTAQEEPQTQTDPAGFSVGYARIDITPKDSVPLCGYGNTLNRMSQGMLDPLYATCIAVTDENGETVLMFTTDLIAAWKATTKEIRNTIESELGVPGANVVITATHTHSGPDYWSEYDGGMTTFKTNYKKLLVEAAKQAMADRSEATMQLGETYTENLNFVRHYLMNDGTYAGDNFGNWGSGIKSHSSEADNQMVVARFNRAAEDKKDIVMINWQAHPKLASTAETDQGLAGRAYMSADYVGALRSELEASEGVLMAFFQGAAGNLNTFSKIPFLSPTFEYKELGKKLSDVVVDCLKNNMKDVEVGPVKTTRTDFAATIDHSDDHLAADAKKSYDYWMSTNDVATANTMAQEVGLAGVYHANGVIRRAGITKNDRTIEIDAIAIGPLGIATASYEMFDTNGKFVKKNSPFDATMIFECANDHNDYLASEEAFAFNNDSGSYEVHSRNFPRGTAEALADEMVSMLDKLHG